MTEEEKITTQEQTMNIQDETKNVSEKQLHIQKEKSKTEIIVLISTILFIIFNAYMFFTGIYASVTETYDYTTVINISYRDIFKQTEGYSTQFAAYMDAGERTESLFYEKLSILCLFAAILCSIIGIIQLKKEKLTFLIVGIMLFCVGSGGLFLVFILVKHAFNSTAGDFGILGAIAKNMLSMKTDTIKHFILNLIISLFTIYEIDKLRTIYTHKGEEKNEPSIQTECNQ